MFAVRARVRACMREALSAFVDALSWLNLRLI